MKEWEKKIAATKEKRNTYVVIIKSGAYVCEKISGSYFVKNEDRTEIKNPLKVIRL